MPFQFRQLAIPDVILIEVRHFEDGRGVFMETYKRSEFVAHGISHAFVQDNFSHSVRGVLRGLHYQKPPHAQAKLVHVIRGKVFDVAVDIRKGSPTYGRWVGVRLSSARFQILYIPIGFAHGFCVLSDEADFAYKVSAEYAPGFDRGILWNDPDIAIQWPISELTLSPKDAKLGRLRDADIDFTYERIQH